MREYQLNITDHGGLGFDAVSIPKDEPIDVDLRIESVSEGVLASAQITSFAVAECGRCLEPLEYEIEEDFQELFEYEKEGKDKKKKKSKN